jgi:hypothetical protein
LGSSNHLVTAQRVIPMVGIGGTIVNGTAGNGAAGAVVDITDLRGKDVYISVEGIVRFRVDAAPTAALWHFSIPAGPVQAFHVPDDAASIQGWGVGAAWAFVIVPIDQET